MPRKIPENLPGKVNKDFWKDAEYYEKEEEVSKVRKRCEWVQDGGHMARCSSCPQAHGQYLKAGWEVRAGEIVRKKPIKF